MHEQRFCCCSCSIRGACYSIAGGKLLILLNDALLMWYNLLLEGGTWTMVHFVMVIIEMLFCLILLVGLRLRQRKLVLSWVWSSALILVVQVVIGVVLVVKTLGKTRYLTWLILYTAADIYMIFVVSSYGMLMDRDDRERQRLEAWAQFERSPENHLTNRQETQESGDAQVDDTIQKCGRACVTEDSN
ncbi:uncharacterized protein [Cherax quadricarinatus]